ncbi:hypothetical protein KBA41_14745 [Candidatus Ozemobacteraceae bacterium]|nr:hypothetical protein [Candidatus Ozemobacteraceae bacterium]
MVSRESKNRVYTSFRGFTIVEILVVIVLAVLVIGGILLAFTQFRRGFSRGEETGVTLQESGLFLARLRSDLINAVPDSRLSPERWREAVTATSNILSFTVYTGESDRTSVVEYRYDHGNGKGSITRSEGTARSRLLVNGRIASLAWSVNTEELAGKGIGSGTRFLWIDLKARFRGEKTPGMQGKEIVVATKLFPARLIRSLN